MLGYMSCVARAPRYFYEISRSTGYREAVRIHHDPAWRRAGGIVQRKALNVSGQVFGCRIVDRNHFGAVPGGGNFGAAVDHAFDDRIKAIQTFTVGLRWNIERQCIAPD